MPFHSLMSFGDYFHLTINKAEAEIIRQIYKWYLEEGYGAAKIANMLNEKGLKSKKRVTEYFVKEFQRIYKAKDENLEYAALLQAQLAKLKKSRERYMEMYTDDLISREELNEKIGGMRKEMERLENNLKLVSYHLTKGEQVEGILKNTFQKIEDIADIRQMTNAQLKRILQEIEVDKSGNIEIFLNPLGEVGLDESVLINDDRTFSCNSPVRVFCYTLRNKRLSILLQKILVYFSEGGEYYLV